MPHKITILSDLDELTDEARVIGAINTVFVRKDVKGVRKYIGANADCVGIREAFQQNFPSVIQTAQGRSAKVISRRSACKSAIYAL